MTIPAPSALALKIMLDICSEFVSQNTFKFSTHKTMVILVPPPGETIERRPNVYLNRLVLTCVRDFKYLERIITEAFIDDDDI